MTDEDLKSRLFVRLYTSLLDDEDMVELSYAAVGVYVVTMLVAKHTAADGQVPIKLLRRDAALRPGTAIEEALDELADAGLVTLDDGHVMVRSWAKYNDLAADIVAKRAARRESSRRANHERWHDGPISACPSPKCNPGGVHPGQSESDPPESDPDNGRNPYSKSHSKSNSHSHSDPVGSEPGPPADPSPDGCHPDDVAAADRLIEILGYLDQPSTTGERRYVARARQRGWPTETLEDLAHEAASKTDVVDVRQWLLGCIRKRANTDPPPELRPRSSEPNIDLDFADAEAAAAAEYAERHGVEL